MGDVPAFFSKMQKECGAVIASLAAKQKVQTTLYAGDPYLHWVTGGWSLGKVNILYGCAGCLAEDTIVKYTIVDQDRKMQNAKGGTIKRLYERFNHTGAKGKGYYQRKQTIHSNFLIQSVNDEGRFFLNEIEAVYHNGIKECFEVITESGLSITATSDHKFFTGTQYTALSQLTIGDEICTHQNKLISMGRVKRNRYPDYSVKYHPANRVKTVRENGHEYVYCRIRQSRVTIEASMNNMSVQEYLDFLNNKSPEEIDKIVFLPRNVQVHHINENHLDNTLSNLMLISGEDHSRHHVNSKNIQYVLCNDIIKSINSVGNKNTYDIKCKDPYNNYVANKFVVHNSGKSTVALNALGRAQSLRPDSWVLIVDSEMYFQDRPDRIERLNTAFGIDLEHCLIISSKQLNVAFGSIFDFIEAVKSKELDLSGVLIDSWKGFENKGAVKKIIAGKVDEASDATRGNAKAMNPILDQLVILASLSRAVFFINQHAAVNQEEYGADYILPGGENLRHQADSIIFLKSLTASDAKMADGDAIIDKSDRETEKIGKRTSFKAEKTRNTVEGKVCECWFNFKEGRFALPEVSLFGLAEKLGVIGHPLNEKGKEVVAHWVFEDVKIVGKDNMIEELKTNSTLYNRIQAACFPNGNPDKKAEVITEEVVEKPKKKGKDK